MNTDTDTAPSPQQVWGNADDLAVNRTGQMSGSQVAMARRGARALPVIAATFGAVMWFFTWLAFRTDDNASVIVGVLGALVLFPVGVLIHVGRSSRRAWKAGVTLCGFGPVNKTTVATRYATKVDVRVGEAVLPLLPMWAERFTEGQTYEVHYSPADHNILSAVHHPGAESAP